MHFEPFEVCVGMTASQLETGLRMIRPLGQNTYVTDSHFSTCMYTYHYVVRNSIDVCECIPSLVSTGLLRV
jgi:hypothetical protein